MDGLRVRGKDNSPICPPAQFAPIDIFRIHEKVLIQQPELAHRLPPDEPKAADQYLDIHNAVPLEIEHMLATEDPDLLERACQAYG